MTNSERFADRALKAVERISRNEVKKTMSGKTAKCSAIWHQPKRPKNK